MRSSSSKKPWAKRKAGSKQSIIVETGLAIDAAKKVVDVELNVMAQAALKKMPELDRHIQRAAELKLELGGVDLKDVKSLSAQKRAICKEWIEQQLVWFRALESFAKESASPLAHQRIVTEIARLRMVEIRLKRAEKQ